jgi:hypothetical protein
VPYLLESEYNSCQERNGIHTENQKAPLPLR